MNIFRKILNLNSEEKKGNGKKYHGMLIERGRHGKLYYPDNNYSIDGDWHDSSHIAYLLQLNTCATKKNQLYEYYDNCPVLILNIAENYDQTKADGIINISDLNSEEYRVYTITDLKAVIHAQIDKFNKSNTDINISALLCFGIFYYFYLIFTSHIFLTPYFAFHFNFLNFFKFLFNLIEVCR